MLNSRMLYRRLLGYVRPHWRMFAAALLCMGLSSLVEPVFPALMKNLLDNGFSAAQGSWDWLLYPLAILGVFLMRAIFGFIGDYTMSRVANNVVLELRMAMFQRMLELPVRYFNDNSSGRLMSRIAYDVGGVTGAATSALTTLLKDSLSVVALLAWLLYLNWQLTLITLAMAPLAAVAMKYFGRRLRYIARSIQETQGELTQVLQEAIEGHKIFKIYGGQKYEASRFYAAAKRQLGFNMRSTVAAALQGPLVQLLAALSLALIMALALRQATSTGQSVGSFVSFITAMLMLLAPLKRLTDVTAPIQRGLAAAESVFALIDQEPETDSGKLVLQRAQGAVEFAGVSFSYPEANRLALQQVSFTIRPGECVALIGPSGGGKTTVANLLPRFYHPQEGVIKIDGQALSEIRLDSLRAQIALVSQEVVLFNDSIAANIAYGAQRNATLPEIRAAAQAAHALEFIEQLPGGFATLIGEKGVKLSGGQRQRLAIARALLKNAPILILDEATSALDTESERQVQAALDTLMQGRTTLVIAHRLSTIERADRILVLNHGQIVESGKHAQLLAAAGIYAKLYSMQFANPAAIS